MLNVLIFLPMIGGFLIWLLLRRNAGVARWAVLAVALIEALVCLKLWAAMGTGGFFAQVQAPWLPALGVQYLLGMDGLSMVLALLTAVVTLGALLVAWNAVEDWAAFGALILIAEGAIMGVLSALDLVLFYVFWEVMIVPIFFLVARRGAGRTGARGFTRRAADPLRRHRALPEIADPRHGADSGARRGSPRHGAADACRTRPGGAA